MTNLQPSNANTSLGQFTFLDSVYCSHCHCYKRPFLLTFLYLLLTPYNAINILVRVICVKYKLNYVIPHLNTLQWLFSALGERPKILSKDPKVPSGWSGPNLSSLPFLLLS